MLKISLSPFLKKYTSGKEEISVDAKNIIGLKKNLEKEYPRLYKTIFNTNGTLNGFVNFYLNGERININQSMSDFPAESHIEIIVSISGG